MWGGIKVRFWKTNVLVKILLKDLLEIYRTVENREARVAEYLSQSRRKASWNLILRRVLNDWEIRPIAKLLHKIERLNLVGRGGR